MKVCIVTPAFTRQNSKGRGGTETYTETLAKALLSKGAEVHVLMYANGILEDAPPIVPVQLHVLALKDISYFSSFFPGVAEAWAINRRLIHLDRAEHFDVIEGMNDEGRMLFVARTFGKRFWMRLLSSLRQHIETKGQPMNWSRKFSVWLDGVATRRSRHLVTHSQSHAREMAREYRVPAAVIKIVPLALEAPLGLPAAAARPSAAAPPTIGYIGTQDRRKGIDVFLQAIPAILAQCPQARFLIIGRDGADSPDGTWRQWFDKRKPDPAVAMPVEFRGFVADGTMAGLWNELTLVIVPSRYESFGLVVVEAYLRGIPVIVSDGGALPEVARNAALIFKAGNVDDLTQKVLSVINSPELAVELHRKGLQAYNENYTLAFFAENVTRLYQDGGSN